jgi:hypothetical protein
MDPERRRAMETSAGLFLMGLGLVVMLLNIASSRTDGPVAILGLGIVLVGGFVYPSH